MGKSFSNGNGNSTYNGLCGMSMGNGNGASPATLTITGARLGAGNEHWWRLV